MPTPSDIIHVTDHARARAQQRGVTSHIIETILAFADRRIAIGGGLRSHFVSRARLEALSGAVIPAADCERADGIVLLVDETENTVVSVVRPAGGRGRRYYRPLKTHRAARQLVLALEAAHA